MIELCCGASVSLPSFIRGAVKKYPTNRMLGRRQVTDGKAGEYVWQTYEEVYQKVMRIGSAIRSLGVEPGAHCGIYGSNCPEWVMAMQACNSQGICYVPLNDTLDTSSSP
ncbi:long chain acyl-CoA synthetase 2 [Miscanthus floridulus]|uniref:long chain acyl-CoA synthetase 2 n=1 Tax=Miscanthus floridulus TaxID=154761 RepID=UPI003459A133